MKILITGATGYIGYQLMFAALSKGHQVHALVRDPSRIPHHPLITSFKGDITDITSIEKAIRGCDAVFHAAAITQLWSKDRSVFYRVNVNGTKNMLDASLKAGIKKFIFTSSCAVLGPSDTRPVTEHDPRLTPFENDYEISKYCAEEMIKEYNLKGLYSVIVAPPRVYGPGLRTKGNPINKLIERTIQRRIAFLPSSEEVVGNYAYIDDVVEGHFLALQKGLAGEKYILGGENLSYKEFFATVSRESGMLIHQVRMPYALLQLVSLGSYLWSCITKRHTHLTPKVVTRLYQHRAVSCERSISQLGYQITPFELGIRSTIHHLKSPGYGK